MNTDLDHAAIAAPLTGPGWGFSPITGTIEQTVASWFCEPRNRGTDYYRAQREAEIVEDVRRSMLPRKHGAHKLTNYGRTHSPRSRSGKVGGKRGMYE